MKVIKEIEIRRIPVSEINPAPYNPRIDLKPSDPEYQKLKKSMVTFGYVELLVWNQRTKTLVSGHQRLKVLIEQGLTEVEVSVVDLSPGQERVLNLSLNKIGEGNWDDDKLAVLIEELQKTPDLDVSLTAFDSSEISQLLDNYHEAKEGDNFDFGAAVESIKEPITKRGDVITLGVHRLMCGDATSAEDHHALFGGEKISLLDIDWPYNVNYMGGSCPRVDTRPKKTRKWDRIYSDNLPQDEYEAFMRNVLTNIKGYLKPGAVFYQWQAHRQLGPLYQILTELDFYTSSLICWKKESAAISYADYSFQTEQAVYGWLKGASHYFAGKPGESNLWEVKRDPTKSYLHSCQKPVALAEHAIRNSSKRNDAVADVCMGSGSVLIAAESLERRCFGMELDSKYCDAIVKRYIAFVGRDKVSQELVQKYMREDSDDRK